MSAAVAYWRVKNGMDLGEATDELECCCPVIRNYLIRLNDGPLWDNSQQRTEMLSPLIPLLIDTRNHRLEQKRAFILADFAVRQISPIALRLAGLESQAVTLESLAEIVDIPTAMSAAAAADDDADRKSIRELSSQLCIRCLHWIDERGNLILSVITEDAWTDEEVAKWDEWMKRINV